MVSIELRDSNATKVLIAQSGYSLRRFSKKINISHSYLSQIINQKKSPSPNVAFRISKGLNLKMEDIFLIQTVEKNNQKKEVENGSRN